MKSLSRRTWISAGIILLSLTTVASARSPYARQPAIDAYMQGYAAIAKASADWLSARADMIKAYSEANINNAKAIQTLEQTRTVALDNELKKATNYYEKRKLHDAYHSLSENAKPTPEELMRYSKDAAPERPTNYQVEPVRGTIRWPGLFQRDEFLETRVQLDYLFAQRKAGDCGLGSENCRQIKEATEKMLDQLRDLIDDLSPAEYMAARRFVDTLAYEAEFAPQVDGVALR
jgi:hypothetical protein